MIDSEVLFNLLKIAGLFVGLSFLVFWVGLVWWVSQDVLTRTSDKIIVAAAVAITAILGPVGVMLYLIIRPKQTLKESYGEMMEHEMMLRAAASTICPMCEHMTQEDFVNCPYCGTVLKQQCDGCEKLINLEWGYCPYCGHVADKNKARPMIETATSLQAETIRELKAGQQVESLSQDRIARIKFEEGQKATFSSSVSLSALSQRQKVTQAGQSALELFKQVFAAPKPVESQEATFRSPAVDSSRETEPVVSGEVESAESKPVISEETSAKKKASKGKATRRAKK
jgi:RNA polymerase subunit RPABC4/transcription elongation factor Spt4